MTAETFTEFDEFIQGKVEFENVDTENTYSILKSLHNEYIQNG
jgi:hypothetical protein